MINSNHTIEFTWLLFIGIDLTIDNGLVEIFYNFTIIVNRYNFMQQTFFIEIYLTTHMSANFIGVISIIFYLSVFLMHSG